MENSMNRRNFLKRTTAVLGAVSLGGAAAAAGEESQADKAARHKPCPGYGRCLERGCDCERFSGRGNVCNCGHSFYKHY
jgi:hypothetical protein